MTPIEKNTATKFQDKEQRKDQKKKEVVERTESMIALCAIESKNIWKFDSGCSKNMKGYLSKFISLRRDQNRKIDSRDNISSKIIGKGTVAIVNNKTKDENVLLVDDLKPNLLSVSQTCDQENICIFYSEKCEIKKKNPGRFVGIVIRNSNNFVHPRK